MKIYYIAGPYRADSIRGVQQNIERASDVAYKYWKEGHAVICPHKNTSFFDGQEFEDASIWLKGDLEILKRCDVIVMMKDWEKSIGASNELAYAESLKKEIIYE